MRISLEGASRTLPLCAATRQDVGVAQAGARSGEGDSYRIGVIADVQYADAPDGTNFARTTVRHFRGALRVLKKAVDYWNESGVDLVANLGDTIDGRCSGLKQSERSTAAVLREFDRCHCENVVHLIGNHDLYNFRSRDELHRWLRTRGADGQEYRSFPARADLRILLLDPYRISLLWPAGHPCREEARALLSQHNPNAVEGRGENWFDGLNGDERRFVPFNGGLGREQLRWLRGELDAARAMQQRTLILTHVPIHPRACDGTTMVWDFEEVLALIDEYRQSVVAVLAGHDHKGGYVHERGVHHVTFKSPLNLGDAGSCFGRIEIDKRELRIRGPRLADLLDQGLLDREFPEPGLECVRLPL